MGKENESTMFSTISPRVYQKLRERRGLSQGQLGKAMGGSRHLIRNFESGKSRPDATQEERMMKILGCSALEFAELAFEEFGELLGTPVGLRDNHGGYEPTSLLRSGYRVLRRAASFPADLVRAVDRRMKEIRLQALLFEMKNTDLRELIRACDEALGSREDGEEQAPAPPVPI